MHRHSLTSVVAFVGSLAALFVASSSNAQLLLDFTGGQTLSPSFNSMAGWRFVVQESATFDQIGIWDEGSNGLANSHELGLWTVDSAMLLRSATITNAGIPVASINRSGRWLFTPIAAITLTPGIYVLGAAYLEDDADILRLNATAETLPGTFFQSAAGKTPSGFAYPNETVEANDGLFGPNLRLGNVASVPEGSSLAMFLLGGLGAAPLLRKRLRR